MLCDLGSVYFQFFFHYALLYVATQIPQYLYSENLLHNVCKTIVLASELTHDQKDGSN